MAEKVDEASDERRPARRDTEAVSVRFRDLERWPRRDLLAALLDGQQQAMFAVAAVLGEIEAAADAALLRLRQPQSRLVYAGAGTSGRIAVLDGVELEPTFGWPPKRTAFLLAGGEAGLTRAQEGAEDDVQAAGRGVAGLEIGPADIVIGLAASGTTPFTLEVLRAARARGALTLAFANNADSPLLGEATHGIYLRTGPEVLAGSTRLAAGTSQKIALNLFSTAVMVGLGKVFHGQMVDMKATNRKLKARAETMLANITGCAPDEAQSALAASEGHVKRAILIIHGFSERDAEARLTEAGGNLHQVLGTER